MKRLVPVFALALLAPLVGEYLLGNVSIRVLVALPFLVPLYGGGALLIREVARRAGCGWPSVLVLGAAYGLVEAGLFDGSLFSGGFRVYDALHYIVGHAVWSITVPIVLVEAFVPERRSTPWLGGVGLAVAGLLYLNGGLIIRHDNPVHASAPQTIVTLKVAVVLIVLALLIRRVPASRVRRAPRPLLVGIAGFVVSTVFFAAPASWTGVAVSATVLVGAALGVSALSRCAGWEDRHRLALAGGALLTYAWGGFALSAIKGGNAVDFAGNAVFAAGAVVLLAFAVRRRAGVPPAAPARP